MKKKFILIFLIILIIPGVLGASLDFENPEVIKPGIIYGGEIKGGEVINTTILEPTKEGLVEKGTRETFYFYPHYYKIEVGKDKVLKIKGVFNKKSGGVESRVYIIADPNYEEILRASENGNDVYETKYGQYDVYSPLNKNDEEVELRIIAGEEVSEKIVYLIEVGLDMEGANYKGNLEDVGEKVYIESYVLEVEIDEKGEHVYDPDYNDLGSGVDSSRDNILEKENLMDF